MRDPVRPGAEPIALGDGSPAVLLLHGFGDTPQSLQPLAQQLHAAGWAVRVPLLRGHGRSLADHARSRGNEWIEDSEAALSDLRSSSGTVSVVGQSMGGALATMLAAHGGIASLVLLAPFFRLSPRAASIAALHGIASLVFPRVKTRSNKSILDADARARALGPGETTPRMLHELGAVVRHARRAAPSVSVPTLVIHSRADPRISIRQAETGFHRIGSSVKTLEWAVRSGHVLAVDFDRDWVAARTLAWLTQYGIGAR
jgi:carboxylesterase